MVTYAEALSGEYVTWKEAITAKVRGGIDEVSALNEWAKAAVGPMARRAQIVINAFHVNLVSLADAPMEPKKEGDGCYDSYWVFEGKSYKDSEGIKPKLERVELRGSDLSVGDLMEAIQTLKNYTKEPVPSLEKFESVLLIQVSLTRGSEVVKS